MPKGVIEKYKQWVEEGLLKFHAKKFTTTNCFFKNYIVKTYSNYYEDETDTVITTQQDYAQSVDVILNEDAITNVIKGYCMPSGLPWHQVDEVYVPINCNDKFHWELAVIFLKDRRIRVYDSLSSLRNMESINEINKLVAMLPTYLSDNRIFEEASRTDWTNLEVYRNKITQRTQFLNEHSFENCGAFVAGYAEYLSEGMNVSSDDFEAEYHQMRYATLLQKYGIQKAQKDYVSKNDDPPRRPRSRNIRIPGENEIGSTE
ncbi:hypothetical protein FXO38_03191 [Capsicum annuum]|nr:hypothetical protein FXO38_03191 [Capsicum annuum]